MEWIRKLVCPCPPFALHTTPFLIPLTRLTNGYPLSHRNDETKSVSLLKWRKAELHFTRTMLVTRWFQLSTCASRWQSSRLILEYSYLKSNHKSWLIISICLIIRAVYPTCIVSFWLLKFSSFFWFAYLQGIFKIRQGAVPVRECTADYSQKYCPKPSTLKNGNPITSPSPHRSSLS